MDFVSIDLEHWDRREHFAHYFSQVPCTYSMTTKVDITPIIRSGYKLYPAMLYCISKVVNTHVEFRMSLDGDGHLGYFTQMHPCYTVFHKDTETFSNIWTEYSEDYSVFLERYRQDVEHYGAITHMDAKPNIPVNTFPVSMIPWEHFDGFNLNLQNGYQYLLPIFTMGKYVEQDGQYSLPVSIQVNHAVCDGFHVCRFLSDLRNWIRLLGDDHSRSILD